MRPKTVRAVAAKVEAAREEEMVGERAEEEEMAEEMAEMAEEGMPVCCKIQYTTRDSHCHHTYRSCNR